MRSTCPYRVLCRLLAIALPMLTSMNALALVPLGPVGNVGLTNPNGIDPDSDAYGSAVVRGDFNADGIDDLAVADRQHPNLVRIYYGTDWNVGEPVTNPFILETVPVPMVPGSSLGPNIALAVGDFTRDITNDDELVVGVPGDSFSAENAGAVFVLDRRPEGNWVVSNTIRQGFDGFAGISESDDHFGASLAVGRFDQNDRVDLAIGIPGETTNGAIASGVVYIVYQGVAGLMNTNEEVFYRGANGLSGVPIANEQLGYALAAGDFNADGVHDLAVGIPGNPCAGQPNAGSVMVLLGRNDLNGLDAAGVTYWSQTAAGVLDDCEAGDRFGVALAAGQFDSTPIGEMPSDDLAIGVPGESIDGVAFAGAVNVLYGSPAGITADNNRLIHEKTLTGSSPTASGFGSRLANGRINAGALTHDSLVIGAPLASLDGAVWAGRIWVIPSSAGELAPARARALQLTPAYALGPHAANDAYGAQLAIGDFNGDLRNDLAVGIPGHDAIGNNAGAVQVMYQSSYIFVDGFED